MSTATRIIRQRRRRARQRDKSQRMKRIVGLIVGVIVGGALLSVLGSVATIVGTYSYFARNLPDPAQLADVRGLNSETSLGQTTLIYDRTGRHVLYEIVNPFEGDRQWIALDDLPDHARYATIATEDRSFYSNPGFDLRGTARAIWTTLRGGQVQGGSTITQQLVRNTLFDPELRAERSIERKISEIVLATEISRRYGKDQILEWYLNTNFYGNLAYGIEAASRVYFGHSARELSLAEASMLAAIPQFPAQNPIDNPDSAKLRQRLVLDQMVAAGYILDVEADAAYAEPLVIVPITERFDLQAPHFSVYARRAVEELLNEQGYDGARLVSRGGLRVYTTLDLQLQQQAECAARTHIVRLNGADPTFVVPAADGSACEAAGFLPPALDDGVNHDASNAALIVLNAASGEVLAMVGSLDYYNSAIDGNYNVALGARQPGSAFKPFVFLTAFSEGFTPASMVLDVQTGFDAGSNVAYSPENYDRTFHGPMSIRDALANSYNVPAVQVMEWVGVDNVIRIAHRMGIDTLNAGLDSYGLALALGSGEVTLMDMTYSFSVLANSGWMYGMPIPQIERRPGYRALDPAVILRIDADDTHGNSVTLWEYDEQQGTLDGNNVLIAELAYLMNDILSDTEARADAFGRDNPLALSRPAAAKSGTTDNFRDSWTIGYTPQLVTGVWVGNTDNTPMNNVSGVTGAAPIWHAVMEYAHAYLQYPVQDWEPPANIRNVWVCEVSGLLPNEHCPQRIEIFMAGTEPVQADTLWQAYEININSGQLATVNTPAELVEERRYFICPPQAADWCREHNIAQPPTEYDTTSGVPDTADVFGPVAIIDPNPLSYVNGLVEVLGNTQASNFSYYRLDYGPGLNPSTWTQINRVSRRVSGGTLGTWDTTGLDGLYTLRLTVVRTDNSIVTAYIQVSVDNLLPSVRLIYPQDGQIYLFPAEEFVTLQPSVEDNLSMDRVEFYIDGDLIATSTVPPFNERWLIAASQPGRHTFYVVAYDAAGNGVESNRVTIEVRVEGPSGN